MKIREFKPPIMRRGAAAALAASLLTAPAAAVADPIPLKLSFFASEQSKVYIDGIKPFVDAVNAEGKGLITIDVHDNASLGELAEQPKLLLDDVTDIAWVVPGQTPYRFPDNELLGMPGLFRDAREGTLLYTRLVASHGLRGYQKFFVIGAYTGGPTFLHSRKPIDSLAALAGQKIRANNPIEAELLERLGATPNVMPASKIASSIANGAIDGAALSPAALFDFGVATVAKNHYLLRGGAAPLVILMNRRKFESLPEAAQAVIRNHSGEWTAARWIASFGESEQRMLERLKTEPGNTIVEPTPKDMVTAQRINRALIESWAAKSPHNRELLRRVDAELATIRSTK
jgi:TRAP-type C4-dicarboxylate transport system substrate-binding protein